MSETEEKRGNETEGQIENHTEKRVGRGIEKKDRTTTKDRHIKFWRADIS